MVEFALVAPMFFFIVFGGIELGLMFRSYLALENLSRSAARIVSIERDNPDADQAIIDRISQQVDPLQGEVQSITIFHTDSLDGEVPPACTSTGSFGNSCNTYVFDTPGDFTSLRSNGALGYPSQPTAAAGPNPAHPGRVAGDNVGIHIVFEYTYATGFFDTLTLSTTTVEVIEQDFTQ